MRVEILRGVSGAGKSTYVANAIANFRGFSVVVSADHYFEGPQGYKFDLWKLQQAHAACFRNFLRALNARTDLVIVDNTNLRAAEISPYVLAASMQNVEEVEVITIIPSSYEEAFKRQKHGVPFEAFCTQVHLVKTEIMPPWFRCRTWRERG